MSHIRITTVTNSTYTDKKDGFIAITKETTNRYMLDRVVDNYSKTNGLPLLAVVIQKDNTIRV